MSVPKWRAASLLLCACLSLAGRGASAQNPDFFSPRAGEWDLDVSAMTGLIAPRSAVEVRENQDQGTILRYSSLGLGISEAPNVKIRYWLTQKNAFWIEGRAAFIRGRGSLKAPAHFNGAVMSSGQTLTAHADVYTLRAAYERRFPETSRWNWDAGAGLEYDYLNFTLNSGHALTAPPGGETKEDFFMQEIPVPFLSASLRWKPLPAWILQLSQLGSWVDRWDSLRQEGGEVYLSQSCLETHARIFYSGGSADGPHPFAGLFLDYYYQLENSSEDGNRVVFLTWGPEAGLRWSF